jgi:hypothetical protein
VIAYKGFLLLVAAWFWRRRSVAVAASPSA